MIQMLQVDSSGGSYAAPSTTLGAGSYAPEGHPDNTASVTAVVPPLSVMPQTPLGTLINTMAPFLPTPIAPVVATLTNGDALPVVPDNTGVGLLHAGNYLPGNPVGGLVNTPTDYNPASATSSGGFPAPTGGNDITAGGNMVLPMISGSAPGSTTVPTGMAPATVLGTPFTMRQLLVAAAALLILK